MTIDEVNRRPLQMAVRKVIEASGLDVEPDQPWLLALAIDKWDPETASWEQSQDISRLMNLSESEMVEMALELEREYDPESAAEMAENLIEYGLTQDGAMYALAKCSPYAMEAFSSL